MYIWYFTYMLSTEIDKGDFRIGSDLFEDIVYPTECCWLVPGTWSEE